MSKKENKNLNINYIQVTSDPEEIEKRLEGAFDVLFNEMIRFEKLKSTIRMLKITSIFSRCSEKIHNPYFYFNVSYKNGKR